jgi:hypothetical protein
MPRILKKPERQHQLYKSTKHANYCPLADFEKTYDAWHPDPASKKINVNVFPAIVKFQVPIPPSDILVVRVLLFTEYEPR